MSTPANEVKHTKGPWKISEVDIEKGIEITEAKEFLGRNGYTIATVWAGMPENELQANAELIAQAPDLLLRNQQLKSKIELLEEAVKYVKDQLFEKKWNGEEGVIDVDFAGFNADGILSRINNCLNHS